MNVVSRIDSFITNKIKFPWDKETEDNKIIFSVG